MCTFSSQSNLLAVAKSQARGPIHRRHPPFDRMSPPMTMTTVAINLSRHRKSSELAAIFLSTTWVLPGVVEDRLGCADSE